MAPARPRLVELELAEDPGAWAALGLVVDGNSCQVGGVRLRLAGRAAGEGILSWTLGGASATDSSIDGLPTHTCHSGDRPLSDAPPHPLGVCAVDHVVVMTPDLERTAAALAQAGLDPRATQEFSAQGRRMRRAFLLTADALVELIGPVEPDGDGPARFWGLTLVVQDVDAAALALRSHAGSPRDAVQPGRRILTIRPDSGVSLPLALISPR